MKIGALKYLAGVNRLSSLLITFLLVWRVLQGSSVEPLEHQQQKITSANNCSVEAMGQPTKLPHLQVIDTAHILLICVKNSLNTFRIEHPPYQSPNVTLLSSHLVYTLTTSSHL